MFKIKTNVTLLCLLFISILGVNTTQVNAQTNTLTYKQMFKDENFAKYMACYEGRDNNLCFDDSYNYVEPNINKVVPQNFIDEMVMFEFGSIPIPVMKQVKSLAGMEHFKNIEYITISSGQDNDVADISDVFPYFKDAKVTNITIHGSNNIKEFDLRGYQYFNMLDTLGSAWKYGAGSGKLLIDQLTSVKLTEQYFTIKGGYASIFDLSQLKDSGYLGGMSIYLQSGRIPLSAYVYNNDLYIKNITKDLDGNPYSIRINDAYQDITAYDETSNEIILKDMSIEEVNSKEVSDYFDISYSYQDSNRNWSINIYANSAPFEEELAIKDASGSLKVIVKDSNDNLIKNSKVKVESEFWGVEEFTTDENGEIDIQKRVLNEDYKVIQLTTAKGLILNENELNVVLTTDNKTQTLEIINEVIDDSNDNNNESNNDNPTGPKPTKKEPLDNDLVLPQTGKDLNWLLIVLAALFACSGTYLVLKRN